MGLTVALALAALMLVLVSPSLLSLGTWRVHRPRLALVLWFSAFAAGCACAVASVCAAALSAVLAEGGSAYAGVLMTLCAWLGLGVLGAVLGLVSVSAEPVVRTQRGTARAISAIAAMRESRDGFTLVRFVADEPVACAVPGAPPEILISTGLEARLSDPQLRAVLAHERAHLRQHHTLAVRIAKINALCLPRFLGAGRRLRQETRLLIELAADDAAAREVGPAHLANALTRVGEATGNTGMLLRARRLEGRRWSPRRRGPELARASVTTT